MEFGGQNTVMDMMLPILLIAGFIAGFFIPRKTVLKVGIYLFIPLMAAGLITPSFLSENYGWLFMSLAMAVGFVTLFTLLGGFVASLARRMFEKSDSN